jgi:succinate-acetate transporter protein
MHPAVSLTALLLSLITAYLIFSQGWTLINAALVVGGLALLLAAAMMGILLAKTESNERAAYLKYVYSVMKSDLNDVLRWFRLKG